MDSEGLFVSKEKTTPKPTTEALLSKFVEYIKLDPENISTAEAFAQAILDLSKPETKPTPTELRVTVLPSKKVAIYYSSFEKSHGQQLADFYLHHFPESEASFRFTARGRPPFGVRRSSCIIELNYNTVINEILPVIAGHNQLPSAQNASDQAQGFSTMRC